MGEGFEVGEVVYCCGFVYISFCLVREIILLVLMMRWLMMCMFMSVSVWFNCCVRSLLVCEGFVMLLGWLWVKMVVLVFRVRVCLMILCGCMVVDVSEFWNSVFIVISCSCVFRNSIVKILCLRLFKCSCR